MLKIKRTYHFQAPKIDLFPKKLVLSPVPSEDDSLIQAIENSYIERGDNWVLSHVPDVQELESFWEKVQNDLYRDPEWFKSEDKN